MFNGIIQVKKEVQLHGANLLPNVNYTVWPGDDTEGGDWYKVCLKAKYIIPQDVLRGEFNKGNIIIIKTR
jgi:hypothetical protein